MDMKNMKNMLRWIPDKLYVQLYYTMRCGRPCNFKNPTTFNEKIQWLKLNDRNPLYTKMVDKYEARQIIADTIGEEYLIPLLGGPWYSVDEIDFDALPDQFVLKCTHDCGGVIICRDKNTFDREAAKKQLAECMKINYYWISREWPYKNAKPKIIAEQYMEEPGQDFLTDYKFLCFHGEPKVIMTIQGGHLDESQVVRRMYDTDWNLIPVGLRGKAPVSEAEPKPEQLAQMLELARKLSAKMKFLRVDLYVVNGRIYMGELTIYHMGGMERYVPESYNTLFGSYLDLNKE